MKNGAIVVLVAIAGIAGYFVGVRHKTLSSVSHTDTPVRAISGDSVRSGAHVVTTTPETAPPPLLRQDPRAAAQEEVEAMRRGDVAAVAHSIVLTAEARAVIESAVTAAPPELTREYPTAELLAAFVFCVAQRIESFRIESTTFEKSDRATQHIAYKFESEPEWRTEEIAFKHMPDGWHRVIDVGLAQRVVAVISIRKQ